MGSSQLNTFRNTDMGYKNIKNIQIYIDFILNI